MLLVVNIIIKIFSLHNLVIDYRLFISVVFLIIYIFFFLYLAAAVRLNNRDLAC